MELLELIGNALLMAGLIAGSVWIWDAFIGGAEMKQPFNRYSRNEGNRHASWLLSIVGLIFWSAVILTPLAVIVRFWIEARK